MNDIIIIIGIIVILLFILTFLLFYVSKRVNIVFKKAFLDKMEGFDNLIVEKEDKLQELNSNIIGKEKEVQELDKKISDSNIKPVEHHEDKEVVLHNYVNFEDENLLSGYKVIKQGFNFNYKRIIEDFVKSHDKYDKKLYETIIRVRDYFDFDSIYKLCTLPKEEQLSVINELLTTEDKNILNNYIDDDNFNIKAFINELDELAIKESPEIIIYTSEQDKNYDMLGENVKTVYDEKITEGFKIQYRGVIYDYSI